GHAVRARRRAAHLQSRHAACANGVRRRTGSTRETPPAAPVALAESALAVALALALSLMSLTGTDHLGGLASAPMIGTDQSHQGKGKGEGKGKGRKKPRP